MWRVSSSDGSRWVQWDGPDLVSASPAELLGVVADSAPVEILPMTNQWYRPDSETDPVAVFLRARAVVGGGVRVTGNPPRVPAAGGPAPEQLLF